MCFCVKDCSIDPPPQPKIIQTSWDAHITRNMQQEWVRFILNEYTTEENQTCLLESVYGSLHIVACHWNADSRKRGDMSLWFTGACCECSLLTLQPFREPVLRLLLHVFREQRADPLLELRLYIHQHRQRSKHSHYLEWDVIMWSIIEEIKLINYLSQTLGRWNFDGRVLATHTEQHNQFSSRKTKNRKEENLFLINL